jgi:RND family efflux transporter MFP subunit
MSTQLTNRITPPSPSNNGDGHAAPNVSHDEVELVPVPRPPRAGFFKLLLVALPVLAIFGGLFLSGWLPLTRREQALASEAQQRTDTPTRVAIVAPKRAAATTELILPGDIQPVQETNLYAHIDGYLKKWRVDIGDDVKAGQLLAEIDTPEVDQQLNQAIAHLAEGHANLALAEADLKRMTDIGGSAIAKQELDDAEAKVNTARATLGVDEANVKSLQSQQAYQKVIAPFGGTITTRNTEVGQLVTNGNGNGQILFHLARTDPVRVFVDVPQTYAPAVKPGQRVQLLVREYAGRTFEGKVTRTARAVDVASRTLRTEVEVPNKDGALIVGMYAKVKLSVTPPGGAMLLIPGSALVINGGGTQVALVRDGKVHFQPVELDADQGAQVGVRGGLAEADQVIATPGERLTEGAAVTIAVPADTQPTRP